MQNSAYLSLLRSAIEQHLYSTLEVSLENCFPELKESIYYQFGFPNNNMEKVRGKRVRPLLVLLTADLLSFDWKEMLPAATAIELLHNFSLIHDDIEDHSPLRRGKETIWKKWGTEKAVNIGDTLFILAVQTIQSTASQFALDRCLESARLFMQTAFSIMEGQQMDMAFEQNANRTVEDYQCMIYKKTAALMALSCEISSVLSARTAKIQLQLHNFGMNLGMAFQIYDDWLGIWGKEEETGKTVYSDLVERKLSYPVLLGLERNLRFREYWQSGGELSLDQIEIMVEILTKEGISQETLEKAAYYNNFAVNILAAMQGSEIAIEALGALMHELIKI